MPTYSDDGQWWWDGRSWQPVTQQPPPPQAQPGQYPPPGTQQYPPGTQQYPPPGIQQPPPQFPGQPSYGGPPPAKKSKAGWIVGGAVVLVLAILAGVFVAFRDGDNTATGNQSGESRESGSDDPLGGKNEGGTTLEPGQPVTDEALSKVIPEDLYFQLLVRQMVAPITSLRSASFPDDQKFLAHTEYTVTEVAIDRRSGKWLEGTSRVSPTLPGEGRCVGAVEMIWSRVNNQWTANRFQGNQCKKLPYRGGNDGIVSSGVHPDTANKVVRELRGNQFKEYIKPQKPTLVTAGGKTYIKQVVRMAPLKLSDGQYHGNMIPMWAFRDAGGDPSATKWHYPWNGSVGVNAVYYIDTKTLLPVATVQTPIPEPGEEGQGVVVFNYAFPKTLPTYQLGRSRTTLALNLPEGWKIVK